MSVSGPTDENEPVPGSTVPLDDDDPVSEADDAPGGGDDQPPETTDDAGPEGESDDPLAPPISYPPALETRPCAYCGRPVPQAGESSPPVRFCTDNDGACAGAAADRRRRDQDSPGLGGQVARTWDMVERLEDVAELLAMSMTGALSVAGVERRMADAQAEAAAALARAHREREATRQEAEQALGRLGAAREEAQRATAAVAELTAQLESAHAERDTARDIGTQATRAAEAANTAIAAVRDERDRLTRRVAELTAALDMARDELARRRADAKEAQKRSMAIEETRTRLRSVESDLDKMRTTAEVAQNARAAAEQACAEADRQALEARAHADEMSAERDAMAAERDTLAAERVELATKYEEATAALTSSRQEIEATGPQLAAGRQLATDLEKCRDELENSRSKVLELQIRSREHGQMVDQLRAALATMLAERDAARAEASEARAEFEQLVQNRVDPPAGARHARPLEFGAPPKSGPEYPSGSEYPPGQLPPGHDLGGVTGPPDSFRRRFLPPNED
jgi:hypothetical protein